MSVGTLVLLRHGESEWNAKNLFTGWVDVDLSAKGRDEATRSGELLRDAGLLPDVVHTSVLRRAITTANLSLDACDRHWVPVTRHWRLNERHYGDLQGKDKAQVREQYGEEQFMIWRHSYDTPPPPLADDNEWSQVGGLGTPIVVILNDNGMSISPNVGALSRYLNRVRLDPGLWEAREGVEEKLTKLPAGIGAAFERLGPRFKESVKAFWAPGLWWEELDWAYLGVIDGHDVRAMRRALRAAFEAERPVVIHCATVKGKGFAPAEDGGLEGMEQWHAAKPKSIAQRRPAPSRPSSPAPPQYTQVFGEALVRECERDPRVIGITAAMNSGTGLSLLQKALPERSFDVGIAEQQAVLFAAGMALSGMRPVAAIYSTFLQRAFDQIVHDVCLQNLPVTFCMDRAGLVGDDGPTHHGVFDIAYLRCLPHITLMAPRDEAMLVHMLHTALQVPGPAAIRYPRGAGVGVALPDAPELIAVGTGEILRPGERVALIGYGTGVGKALGAADLLAERGLDVTVADARFAKPLDARLLSHLALEHDLLVTVEEGVLAGGFGSAVWETLSEEGAAVPRILRVGLPDRYVTHGAPALLHEEVGFTAERIAERVEAAMLDPHAAL